MRILVLLLVLIGSVSVPGRAEPSARDDDSAITVSTDQRQIAMSTALVLAGFGAETKGGAGSALRDELRAKLATVDPALRSKLETFYRTHRRAEVDEATDAIRYRALAVLANAPPTFTVSVPTARIPADVKAIAGFAPLVGELYRSSAFKAIRDSLVKVYNDAGAQTAKEIDPSVAEVLGYVRVQPMSSIIVPAILDTEGKVVRPAYERVRRLKVYVDPLLVGRAVAVRGDLLDAADLPDAQRPGDRFFVFAGDSLYSGDAAVRLALLRFVLTPIVEKYAEEVSAMRVKIDDVLAISPVAKERYGDAQLLAVLDSLVSAMNARLQARSKRLTDAGALASLAPAYERGEVLSLHFYDRLRRFEETGFDAGVFFPEFVRSIDLRNERGRAEQLATARATVERERAALPPAEDEFASEILGADRLITQKRFDEARPILERILQTSQRNARALFGLAQVIEHSLDPVERDPKSDDADRAAAQAERLEAAVNLYRQAALNANPRELWLASWSHVYAGRILDFLDLREEAVAEYEAAVKVGDVPQGAFAEAKAGLAAPYSAEPGP